MAHRGDNLLTFRCFKISHALVMKLEVVQERLSCPEPARRDKLKRTPWKWSFQPGTVHVPSVQDFEKTKSLLKMKVILDMGAF